MHPSNLNPIHLLTHFSIDLAKIYFLIARNVFLKEKCIMILKENQNKKTFKQRLSILCVTEEKKNDKIISNLLKIKKKSLN
jgi:hypothetical protein